MSRNLYSRNQITLTLAGVCCLLMTVTHVHAAGKPELDIPRTDTDKTAYVIDGSPTKAIDYYSYDEEGYVVGGDTYFTYSQDGNVTEELTRYNTDGVFTNSSRTITTYDAQGVEQSMIEYSWIDGTWQGTSRETYTYVNGRLTESLSEYFNGTVWEPSYKVEGTYSPDGTSATSVSSLYDSGNWTPYAQYAITLNGNGDPLTVLSGYYYGGVYSGDNSREVYEYNNNGSVVLETFYNRSSESDPWEVHTIMTYTYDDQGRLTGSTMSIQDWETGDMKEHERMTYTYNADGHMTEEEMFYRPTADDPWEPTSKTVYVYGDEIAVEEDAAPAPFALMQNSPNPFNPATVIPFSLNQAGPVTLDVYSANGQKVATLVDSYLDAGVHQMTWNAAGLASGVYFSRLTVEGMTSSAKMLLVK